MDERSDPTHLPGTPPELPHPESLCHRCAAARYVRGKSTLFIRCTALPAKYPPQPVLRCDAHRPRP